MSPGRTRSWQASRRPAFTLIELLVVIAVIALLIGILLPSLGSARETGRAVRCLANQRQFVTGFQLYADDYRGASVPAKMPNLPGGINNPANHYEIGNGLKFRPNWIAIMGPYVGLYPFDNPSTTDGRMDYTSPVYQCPTVGDWVDERNHAYGYNYQFLGNSRLRSDGRYRNWPVRVHTLSNPSMTVMSADSMGTAAGIAALQRTPYENNGTLVTSYGNHAHTLDPPRLTPTSDMGAGSTTPNARTGPHDRHAGQAVTVFIDGHAKRISAEELGYRWLPDGSMATIADGPDVPDNTLFSGHGRDLDPPDR